MSDGEPDCPQTHLPSTATTYPQPAWLGFVIQRFEWLRLYAQSLRRQPCGWQ